MHIKRSIAALAAIICAACITPALAANDGYEGLIAPSQPDPAAPAQPLTQTLTLTTPPPVSMPTQPYSNMTLPTGRSAQEQPLLRTQDDLNMAAMAYDARGEKEPPPAAVRLTEAELAAMSKPRPKIDGMSGAEYMAAQTIKSQLAAITDNTASPEQRAENLKTARRTLGQLAEGLRRKTTISDSMYRDMGLSDQYIADQRQGVRKALEKLDAALQTLQ